MKYRSLTLENFGPYYGRQTLQFGRDHGVWIVYGDNGRGKTTLLNAFRYALYGKVLGRRSERRPVEMANSLHAREVGHPEFKTILEFEHDGDTFRLTRHYLGTRTPEETTILEKNGNALRDDVADAALRAIAPESISQFFLFDGELLRQYEDLRDPSVDSGEKLREEVDRILGVHAIENGIRDLREINAAISKEKARKLVADKKHAKLAQALAESEDLRGRRTAALSELRQELQRELRRIDELEDALAKHEQAQLVLERIDTLRSQEASIEARLHSATEDLQALAPDAWRAVLAAAAQNRLAVLREESDRANEARIEAIVASRTCRHLEAHSDCPVCDTNLDPGLHSRVLDRARRKGGDEEVERLDRIVSEFRRQSEALEHLLSTAKPDLLVERQKAVSGLALDLSEVQDDISDQEEKLRGIDVVEVRRHRREREQRAEKVLGLKRDVRATEEAIRGDEEAIAKIKRELSTLNIRTNPVLELKDEVSAGLLELFGAALERYQSDLLNRVEDQASKLFMEVRAEDEYARLKIHDGYGLTIVDESGTEVQGHSAGYEHLVALSLIAALQRCSPVQGPIVMDSPFGRLDEVHTRNVVTALPQVADQVVLLAFHGEFDRDAAVAALGSSLADEYALTRVSARHTEIVRREDAS